MIHLGFPSRDLLAALADEGLRLDELLLQLQELRLLHRRVEAPRAVLSRLYIEEFWSR